MLEVVDLVLLGLLKLYSYSWLCLCGGRGCGWKCGLMLGVAVAADVDDTQVEVPGVAGMQYGCHRHG